MLQGERVPHDAWEIHMGRGAEFHGVITAEHQVMGGPVSRTMLIRAYLMRWTGSPPKGKEYTQMPKNLHTKIQIMHAICFCIIQHTNYAKNAHKNAKNAHKHAKQTQKMTQIELFKTTPLDTGGSVSYHRYGRVRIVSPIWRGSYPWSVPSWNYIAKANLELGD